MNRLIGYGPVLMNASQVTGVDSQGNFIKDEAQSWGEYKLHMLKLQNMLADQFGLAAKVNDQTANMADLADKLGSADSAEND